jgi:hypothetical protein
MEPHLSPNDKQMFYKYLDKCTNYFEYGSGGSTYQAFIRPNIQKIVSIESDIEWYNKIRNMINGSKIEYIYNDMNVKPNTWGYPGTNASRQQKINYSNHFTELGKNSDLILIDGRFRVACCLKCFSTMKDTCFIAFDDFLDRKQYHIVLNFFDIIEKTVDNRMVILKKKSTVKHVPQDIILKYELIAE